MHLERAWTMEDVPAARSAIPDTPGSYQFKDAQAALRRQAKSLRSTVELLRSPDTPCPAPARWWRMRRRSVDRVRNEVEALFLGTT
jgi:hypothetical protein